MFYSAEAIPLLRLQHLQAIPIHRRHAEAFRSFPIGLSVEFLYYGG